MEIVKFWLSEGGLTAWFIVFAAAVLVTVAIDRWYTLFVKLSFDVNTNLETIRNVVKRREYTNAIQICNSYPNAPDLQVVKSGLLTVESGREAMKSSIGASILEVSRVCEKRIGIVALIAAVSTLLGLLGTISGLIKTFAAIASADAATKAQLLGNGISEAMYSTAAGLVVGIAAMVMHTILVSKSDEIVAQAQATGFKFITWLEEAERGVSA